MSDVQEFVKIELTRNQIFEVERKSEVEEKRFRCLAPDNGSFYMAAKNLYTYNGDEKHVFFSFPAGTEINISYPEDGEWKEKKMSIDDLKAAYDEKKAELREEYKKNSENFVTMTVPTEWGIPFKSNKEEPLVSVKIPTFKGDKMRVYETIIRNKSFKPADEKGYSQFSLPKEVTDKNGETKQYNVTLTRRFKDGDLWSDEKLNINTESFAQIIEVSKERFVGTRISKKSLREFEHEGKKLFNVSVPVQEAGNTVFYNIVVSPNHVKQIGMKDYSLLMLYKVNKDKEPYEFTAKRSVKNEEGGFDTIEKEMTASEVVDEINLARENYKSMPHTHSLADEEYKENTQEKTETANFTRRRYAGR